MSPPEPEGANPLARRDSEPVFDEPWQAQALGLAFSLAERGLFTPAQWSQALGAEHRRLLKEGASDTPQTYYEAVTGALERLISECEICPGAEIEGRTKAWRRAYLNTPHGKPVQLEAGLPKAD